MYTHKNKNSQKILFLLSFSLLLFLTGCESSNTIETNLKNSDASHNITSTTEISKNTKSEKQENIDKDDSRVRINVFYAQAENNSSTLSLSGTIVANEEVTASAQASGVISKVWKKEGEAVADGERILMLDEGHNLALSAYNSAQTARSNASTSLNLYQQSSFTEVKNAEISERQAQTTLEQTKRTQNSEKNAITAQVKNSKAQKELAEKNLKIAETALAQTQANEIKIQKNILENTGNTLSQTLVNFRSSMNMADELIGASQINKTTNDTFEVYLEGTTVGIMLPTKDLWRRTQPKIKIVEEKFRNFEKDSYNIEDEENMISISSQTIENAKNLRIILRNIETMLKESIPSQNFTQERIDSLKAQLVQHQNSLEQNLSQLTAVDQALSDFHIQSPQRITNAELKVSVAQSQLLSAQQSYSSFANTGNTNTVKINSALTQAQQKYRAAKNAVESAKIRTQISIQAAKAQYNSANAQLAQAEISLSKLTLRSGIQGTITKILKKEGDTVSIGTPLAIISDYSSLKLKGDVSVAQRLKIKKGMTAEIRIDDINQTFSGKISLISPEADKITKRVAVEITIPNDANIPANIFATAEIFLTKQEDTIFVPQTAVLQEKINTEDEKEILKNFVYIAKPTMQTENCLNKNAKVCYILTKQAVETGLSFSSPEHEKIQITSGISSGANIIENYSEISELHLQEGEEIIPTPIN